MRDVHDHLTQMNAECNRHLEHIASLIDQLRNIRASSQTQVLYVLSVVAAMFLPAQFLTGLYGMNFKNMPELGYENGYFIWWGVVLTIASSTFCYFKFIQKWI